MNLFRSKKQLKTKHFTEQWYALQSHCGSRKTWPDAIIAADELLSEALKKRGYKGKTTGERLVAAQRDLSSNDKAWFGHKYRGKMIDIDVRKLKKMDMLEALAGFREALRDLGALER
jgi:hypothetical protein